MGNASPRAWVLGVVASVLVVLGSFSGAWGASLLGKVFHASGYLDSGTVQVYRDFADLGAGSALHTVPVAPDGDYRLELPEGGYVVTARGEVSGRPFHCYNPANPISLEVQGEVVHLPLLCAEAIPATVADRPGAAQIRGSVSFLGNRLSSGHVALYAADAALPRGLGYALTRGRGDALTRGRGYRTVAIEADGSFACDVEPGRYLVVGRQQSGGPLGPPSPGDLSCFYGENPVTVGEGKQVEIDLSCFPAKDLSRFVQTGPGFDPEGEMHATASVAYRHRKPLAPCAVQGRVRLQGDGAPAPGGLYVLARPASEDPVFHTHLLHPDDPIPVAVTAGDGSYQLALPGPGLYYLAVRERLGTSPGADRLFGFHQGDPFSRVRVDCGEVAVADFELGQ